MRLYWWQPRAAEAPAQFSKLPAGRGWLMVEFGADAPEEARERALTLARAQRSGSLERRILAATIETTSHR